MTENEVTVDFKSPIIFDITISKIEAIDTVNAKRIWVEGKGIFDEEKHKTVFYCPKALEYLLRDMETSVGDTISIRYLGKQQVEGSLVDQFHVKKV